MLSAALYTPDEFADATVKVQIPIKAPDVAVVVSVMPDPLYAARVAVVPAAAETLKRAIIPARDVPACTTTAVVAVLFTEVVKSLEEEPS